MLSSQRTYSKMSFPPCYTNIYSLSEWKDVIHCKLVLAYTKLKCNTGEWTWTCIIPILGPVLAVHPPPLSFNILVCSLYFSPNAIHRQHNNTLCQYKVHTHINMSTAQFLWKGASLRYTVFSMQELFQDINTAASASGFLHHLIKTFFLITFLGCPYK